MRNDEWLESRLEYIYKKYFKDVDAPNMIHIKFGRCSRTRLGSIKKKDAQSILGKVKTNSATEIVINGHFRDEFIPKFVVDAVIAHELSHYAHGFSSPLPQLWRHPHKGGVVSKEMKDRGLTEILKMEKKWIKENWRSYIKGERS